MTTALLSTTYFGPVQWYQKLYRYDRVLIDGHETFPKQTYRNRCHIAAAQGVQALTVPVEHDGGATRTGLVRISDHGNWRHQHWQAITSAYGDSPFFEYYEDDLRPFFFSHDWELLADFNEAICQTVCNLIDLHPIINHTDQYLTKVDSHLTTVGSELRKVDKSAEKAILADYRDVIRPKHPIPDSSFMPRSYWQVFAQRHGFLPNLSILDLLCCMGPESIFYL